MTRLRIDTNNVNTYYYKNTTKRCRYATFHSQEMKREILERKRDISRSILRISSTPPLPTTRFRE